LRRARLWRDLVGFGHAPSPGEVEEVDSLLTMLGLDAVADTPGAALGLGTARLVEVARAIATKPRVILLDEPSSGLDAGERRDLARALVGLRDEHGLALLLVEHDVELVLSLADTVSVLDFGQVIAAGPAEQIRRDPAVRKAYLGSSS
jgi:branched-chain amino acid transport system ATP-binding protein